MTSPSKFVGLTRNNSRLEDLLPDDGGKGVRGDVGVSLQKPGVTRTRLEDQLATPRPAGLQVDERANLLGPDVLRNEAVTSLKKKDI